MINRMENLHLLGHSNVYFLNDFVPVLDFCVNTRLHQVYTVDHDGAILIYGTDAPKTYCYAPVTQYFAHDYEKLNEMYRLPIDMATNQPAERLAPGPLIDYLRAPYQYQQVDPSVCNQQWLQLREQEVSRNKKRMEEIAREERSTHDQNENALRETDDQEMLDEVDEPEAVEEGEEFETPSEESESEEDNEGDGLYEEEAVIQPQEELDLSEEESIHSHTTRLSRQSRQSMDNRANRSSTRRERVFRNDIVDSG